MVGIAHPVLREPHRRFLQFAKRGFERGGDFGGIARGLGLGNVAGHQVEERAHPAPAVLGQFAPDQVHRLDAVGAFVDLGDAGVTDELLHSPFGDIAVPAEHLLRVDRDLEPAVGEVALDHRGQQRDDVVRGDALFLGLRLVAEIDLERPPQHQRARRLVERLALEQHAANVGMDEQSIGLGLGIALVGKQGATLAPVLGVSDRILIGDLALRQALQAHAQPRRIHHDEHRRETLLGLADQPAGRAVVIHDAGRIAVNPHLVLDRAAGERIARPDAAVVVDQELGHDEQ